MKPSFLALLRYRPTKMIAASILVLMSLWIALPVFAQESEAELHVSILVPLMVIGLYSLFIVTVHHMLFRDQQLVDQAWLMKRRMLLSGALILGLLIRLLLAAFNEGYVNDLNLFHYWGNYAFNEGLLNLYHGDFFLDYPPGYLYVLYIVAAVQKLFGITYGSAAFLILYKLPTIIVDLCASYYIYKQANKKLSFPVSFGLMMIYLFNPVVLLDGAVWGQVDSIFTFLIIISVGLYTDGRLGKASVIFALAALTKPQAFIFMPIVLLVLLYKKRWKAVITCAAWGFGTFLLLSLPLFLKGGGLWQLIDLYRGTLSSYAYATLNAFNTYMLFNLNWVSTEHIAAGATLGFYGMIAIFAAVAYAAFIGIRSKAKSSSLYFIAAALLIIVFMFVTKMHERYMFAAIALLVMAFIQSEDRRLLYLSYGFTFTNTLNLYVVLEASKTTTFIPYDGVAILCSVANLVMTFVLLYVGYDLYVKERVFKLFVRHEREHHQHALERVLSASSTDSQQKDRAWYNIGMTRKDWIIVASVTAVYTIISLINLGSTNGPKTVWQPATIEDTIVFDLGESKQLQRVISFGGVGDGEYRYSFSNDGASWTDEQTLIHDHVAVFLWKEADVQVAARYVKLQPVKLGFSLHEMGFFEVGSQTPLPVQVSTVYEPQGAARGAASHLIDEQSIVPFHHTYSVGSYFDEIYHARTAYEHLEGIQAYESTHPPLGKILISLGVQLFGLSPFGWRIVGAICGALMLPIIYLMAKAILRRSGYAVGAMLLYAVDFMHFTQTRISTIDVYAVLFIMLMFYFMQRYASMNFYRDRLRKTFIPLGLAGLFFGFGIASKWIVFYGGAGLAVMLAITLLQRYFEYRSAGVLLHGQNRDSIEENVIARAQAIRARFFPYTISTIAICLLFYIAIPLSIYALANIPVLKPMESGYTLKALIDYQVNMYNYHSNLVSSHPFSSTWWEWPFMKRPVWYYLDSAPMEGMRSTIAAFGNPLIWWSGLFTMLATTVISIRRKDQGAIMLVIAYFSQYVPWMLVPRETFLYHYFAMVPFMIVSIMYVFKLLEEKFKWSRNVRLGYITAAVVLFAMFYPVLSGMPASEDYIVHVLRWFPSWLF